MTELIELDLSDKEQEEYIRNYIKMNMLEGSLEQYVFILNSTDSLAEACQAAILNEYICKAIHEKTKTMTD